MTDRKILLLVGANGQILDPTDQFGASRLARAADQPAWLDHEILGDFRRALSEYCSAGKMLGPRPADRAGPGPVNRLAGCSGM